MIKSRPGSTCLALACLTLVAGGARAADASPVPARLHLAERLSWGPRGDEPSLPAGEPAAALAVPINAALQEIGQHSIGSGGAVAMQNFFQNVAMLLSVGLYTLAASQQVAPIMAFIALGALLIAATTLLILHLPESSTKTPSLND